MSVEICGAQNPRDAAAVCLRGKGHYGKHGKPVVAYRSVFWGVDLKALRDSGGVVKPDANKL